MVPLRSIRRFRSFIIGPIKNGDFFFLSTFLVTGGEIILAITINYLIVKTSPLNM